MNLPEKLQLTLDELFASFDVQKIIAVDQSLKQTLSILDSSAHQVLILMHEKKIKYDEFLTDKCLPLIRFYLAPGDVQEQTLLSAERLAALFAEIPAVEAFVLKNAIATAVQKRKSTLQKLLNQPPAALKLAHPHKQPELHSVQEVDRLLNSPQTPDYLDCFYQVQAGELRIADKQRSEQPLLAYNELSPLQQLEAQRLCKRSRNRISA